MVKGYGYAPGKVILIGEHSVVYGKGAIALPFDKVGVSCTIKPYFEGIYLEMDIYRGLLGEAPEALEGLKVVVEAIRNRIGVVDNLKMILDIKMPHSRGLGYSAAVSVAIIRAFYDAYNKDLDDKTLIELTHAAESYNHTNPSGLDGYTIIANKPIYYSKHRVETLRVNFEGVIVVADTGIKGNTKEAVEAVATLDKVELNTLVNTLDVISNNAKHCLEHNDVFTMGNLLNEAHRNLVKLGASNDALDALVKVSLDAGALGAKLTGGGKGGCMIALCKNEEVAKVVRDALKQQGAPQTWSFTLGGKHE